MYDTIGAFLETKESLNKYVKVRGIYQNENGISINLSIPDYFLGNNIETISRKETELAIEKLSDELHLNIKNSKLYRIDVGGNIIMAYKLSKYLIFLDECTNFKKGYIDSTLYYKHYLKTLAFYDKIKKARRNGIMIPIEFSNCKNRLLRYELRIIKRFKKQFGRIVFMKDLTDKDFYNNILEQWEEYYFKINKKKILKINSNAFYSIKSLKDYLITEAINEKGLDSILNHIDTNRDRFKDSSIASNCKRIIREFSMISTYDEENELILELDRKIKETAAKYRE